LTRRTIGIGAGLVVLAAVAAVAAIAFFNARDDATVSRADGPGVRRPAGAPPRVRAGNVLLLYRDPAAARGLRALADELAGPPDPALEAAGQAVVVRRDRALGAPVRALSATKRQDAPSAGDPVIRGFAEYWLGRDAR
jgi:hypothetical protein